MKHRCTLDLSAEMAEAKIRIIFVFIILADRAMLFFCHVEIFNSNPGRPGLCKLEYKPAQLAPVEIVLQQQLWHQQQPCQQQL